MTVFGVAALLMIHGLQQDAPKPTAPTRPINTIDRRDTIGIFCFESPDASGKYVVSVDGTISGPFFGTLRVEGLTLDQANAAIVARLKKTFKNPHVDTFMVQEAPAFVYVVSTIGKGSVVAPYSPGMTLRQVLASAQAADEADRIVVTLIRDGQVLIKELLSELVNSDKSSTPLRDLDTVTVTPVPSYRVYVLGAVDKPGEKTLIEGTTLNKLMAIVGGVKVDTVSNQISDALGRSRIVVRRGEERFEFPATASDQGEKFKLQAGDTISAELPQVVH
ncbi:MAG: polysaccharide biosynthesis/export family protein, partial [Armatimonadota bacterium]